MTTKQKKMLWRIIAAALLTVALQFIPAEGVLRFVLFFAVYLLIGYDILRKAWRGLFNGRLFDECFLMAIATIGAFALAIYSGSGDYNEAVAVMLFYQIGEFFQGYAAGKSRRNIGELMDIRPDYANVEAEGGSLEQVDPDDVEVGTVISVLPGERVPIDGTVISGSSTLNTAALTGESLPRSVGEGDEVISGCINMDGVLKVRTTKPFGESTVSRILELVENASSRKSKPENFISKFARVYTPSVCIAALALFLVPPLVRMLALGLPAEWGTWLYRALTFLVISCPCALVISIPLTFFAGLGGAGHDGILIKGSNFLEALSKTKIMVFDKTGTLTKGSFELAGVHHAQLPEDELLELAALAESASSHPISKSLQQACEKELDRSRVTDIHELSGLGVTAVVDGRAVACGNEKLMRQLGLEPVICRSAGTVVHIAVDGSYAGHMLITDSLKAGSPAAISELKAAGVQKTVMLTGDIKAAAEAAASELGVDEFYSGLLPADKVEKVEELLASKPENAALAFAGDGINDAPVLSRADIGIAMGALGSDAAIEAADVVLMDDDPRKIAKAIRISRKCMRIVYENIFFALAVKFACLLLSALGIANMWLAIFADVGVMVIAVLNAMRALRVGSV